MSRTERKRQAAEERRAAREERRAAKAEADAKAEAAAGSSGSANAAAAEVQSTKEKNIFKRFARWFKSLKTWQRAVLIAVTAIVVIAIVGGIIAYAYLNSLYEEMHEPTPENYDLSLVAVDGYINILLLGIDSRDMEDFDNTRSDAIMMVSINEETSDVKVLSVYRDTYLKLGDTPTFDKITHACAYGGPELAMKTMNQAMDLNISNYVVVNFKAVADLVDAVGGIEVNVEEYEIRELNKYTIETAENIGREDYQLVEAPGMQTLEGVQAVSYGRIRKGVGDDFKRTERMRTVVSLVTDKLKERSFGELKELIEMLTPQVRTNLSRNDILALAMRLPQYNIVGTTGWPYNVSTGYIGQTSYVFPSSLADNVVKLHQEFFGQVDYVLSETAASISAAIIQRIEAAKQANELQEEETDITTNEESRDPAAQTPDTPATEPGGSETETPDDPNQTGPGTTTDPSNPGGTGDANNPGGTGSDTPGGTTNPSEPGGTGDSDTPAGGEASSPSGGAGQGSQGGQSGQGSQGSQGSQGGQSSAGTAGSVAASTAGTAGTASAKAA